MQLSDSRFDGTPRDDEIKDLSPSGFRFIVVILIGLGILAVAGIL